MRRSLTMGGLVVGLLLSQKGLAQFGPREGARIETAAYFGRGDKDLNTFIGQSLLAHEAAHVIQQFLNVGVALTPVTDPHLLAELRRAGLDKDTLKEMRWVRADFSSLEKSGTSQKTFYLGIPKKSFEPLVKANSPKNISGKIGEDSFRLLKRDERGVIRQVSKPEIHQAFRAFFEKDTQNKKWIDDDRRRQAFMLCACLPVCADLGSDIETFHTRENTPLNVSIAALLIRENRDLLFQLKTPNDVRFLRMHEQNGEVLLRPLKFEEREKAMVLFKKAELLHSEKRKSPGTGKMEA